MFPDFAASSGIRDEGRSLELLPLLLFPFMALSYSVYITLKLGALCCRVTAAGTKIQMQMFVSTSFLISICVTLWGFADIIQTLIDK